MRRASVTLLAWYFLTVSSAAYGHRTVATNGPFPNRESCEVAATWVQGQALWGTRISVFGCWESK